MTEISKEEFNKCMVILSSGVKQAMTENEMEAYYLCLRDVEIKHLKRAIFRWLKTQKSNFLPSIAELNEMATEDEHGVLASHSDAWQTRCEAVKRFGYYQPREARNHCGEQVWKTISQTGGWDFHCYCPPENKGMLAAQFRMAYQNIESVAKENRMLPEPSRPKRLGSSKAIDNLARNMGIDTA